MTQDALVCEGCFGPLSEADLALNEDPRLCVDCRLLVEAPATRPPRHPKATAEERRAIMEPIACPYCMRRLSGVSLVDHIRGVHRAKMALLREGVGLWRPAPPHGSDECGGRP